MPAKKNAKSRTKPDGKKASSASKGQLDPRGNRNTRQRAGKKNPAAQSKREVQETAAAIVGEAREGDSRLAVVGLGASAGGLDAFRRFLSAMPDDTGMAFVLIQHLDPTHPSLTAELLGNHTRMGVLQVEDEMRAEPNHVYVIPPNKYLTISGQTLHLTDPVERRGVRVPIDFFFRSLADDQQERAIGIILSGTGTDGTLGAREIKAAGGMVMAQAPEFAQYDGMPRSVIASGAVDYVLPVEKMSEVLGRYARHWYVNGAPVPAPVAEKAPDHLTTITGLLRARLKFDFSSYKKGTLTRRIQRRMGLNHVQDVGDYVEMLRQDRDEVTALYKDLLIGVTNFFREPKAWEALEEQVIKRLVREHDVASPIRVWVPGCATGEEAYSIAILLTEEMQEAARVCGVNIFASDIDQDALGFARAGVYPENIAAHVSRERLRRFFTKGQHTYRVNKDIREAVIFAEQNLIRDPPFSRLDLISCRNLLIYLEPEIQKKILTVFHFALREGAYLILGNAETIGHQYDLFRPASRKWRIYRRVGAERHAKVELPVRHADIPRMAPEAPPQAEERRTRRLAALAQQALIQRYAPASVLVNRMGEVLYLNGPVDDYLQLPTGELGPNLIAMARPGLRSKLRSAVHQATQEDRPVTVTDGRVRRSQKYFPVRFTVEPLPQHDGTEGLLLVAFDEAGPGERQVRLVYVERPETEPTDTPATAKEWEAVIHHLEGELTSTREDLHTTIEELETTNEEFRATNEEVTSINEELQSTNEELETSKEELQSMNEELQTLNSQLESKVGELEVTNNDLQNLLTSIDSPVLFLDRGLRIRRLTPTAAQLFRVIETDIGRPFGDFAKNVTDEDLVSDAERVLKHLTPIEKEVQDGEGRWYLRRVVPYRTDDDHIDGVVITFADITARFRAAEFIRLTIEAAPLACVMVNPAGQIALVNSETEGVFGYDRGELVGQSVEMLVPQPLRVQHAKDCSAYAADPVERSMGTRRDLSGLRRDGSEFPVEISLSPVETPQGPHILATITDVTQRKRAQERLEASLQEKESLLREVHHRVKNNLQVVSSLLDMHAHTVSDPNVLDAFSDVSERVRSIALIHERLYQSENLASVDLAAYARSLLETLWHAHGTEKVRLTLALQELTMPVGPAVPLGLILNELATNALQHAFRDREVGEVRVGLEYDPATGGVCLSVRDDGAGLPPTLDWREPPTLGLRLVHMLARQLRGTVELGEGEGAGTEFRVRFVLEEK